MEPALIALIGFFTLGTTAVIWWLVQVETQMRHLREETAHMRELMRSDLTSIRSGLGTLSADAKALRRTYPAIDGVLEAHDTLDSLESSLEAPNDAIDDEAAMRDRAHSLIGTLRNLLAGIEGDGVLKGPTSIKESIEAIISRFVTFCDHVGLVSSDLGLDDLELRRLGQICHGMGRRSWSESCYESAAILAPGNHSTQKSLAHLARERGDDAALRSALDALLRLDPDDEGLLREHAALLAAHGDEAAERDVRRLEAMGVDNATDRSLLSSIRSRAGDHDEAMVAIDEALESNPTSATDWLAKAGLHADRGDVMEAISALDETLSIDRSIGAAWGLRARLLADIDSRVEDALKSATHAVALGEPLHVLKSDLLIRTDQTEEAFESLASGLEKDPADATIRAHLSWLHQVGGDATTSQAVLDAAPPNAWDSSSALHIQKGRLRLHRADARRDGTGEHDASLLTAAISCFDDALIVDREDGLAWLGRARCLRQMTDLEEAEISLQRARRLLPEEPMVAVEEALLALDRGRVDDAAILIKEAAGAAADEPVIHYVRGLVAAQRGQFGEARRCFETVIEAEPNHVRARLNHCSVSMLLDDLHLALDDANALLSLYPDLDVARLRRCEILMSLGDWPEAETEVRNLLERKPHHPPALTHLGRTLTALGRIDEALPYLDEAIRLDPKLAEGWYQRGLYYLEHGTTRAALDDFEAAAKADPTHLDALLHAAAVHHESDEAAPAIAAWRQVLDLDPDHTLARVRLEEIRPPEPEEETAIDVE